MELEKKEAPTLNYNENKDPDPNVKGHFIITQLQTLFVAIFITAMMQFSNYLALYLIYCFPMYFFIVFIQWFAFWKPKADCTLLFNIFNGVMFIICLPIFFGVFFAVFHPTASIEFKQAQNCQLVGQLSKWIEFTEKYSILYINFEYEGKQYLGQACASNFNDAKTTSPILPYKFYYKQDLVACGPIDGNNTSPQYHRLLTYKNFNSTEVNRNQRILKGRSGGRSSRSTGSTHYSSSTAGSCYRNYKWSYVKIASWLCQDRDFDIEEYMDSKSCYVNFFSGEKAYQNGQQRAFMRDQYNFPLIAYKEHAYYPEADLVCLILFSYYNWILSFNSIFQYTANYILKKIRRTRQNSQTDIQALEFKQNPNIVQMEQMPIETPVLQSNIYQINQQQVNPSDNVDCMPQPQYMLQQALPQDQQYLNNPEVQFFSPPFRLVGLQQQQEHQNEDNIVNQQVKINNSFQNPML